MTPLAAILVHPVIPAWLIALLVIGLAVAGWYTYRECALPLRPRLGLWGLRLAALLILAWLLLLPDRRNVTVNEEAPVLAVAVDVSASMTERVGDTVVGRDEKVLEFLTDSKVQALCKRYRVIRYDVGADVQETGAPGDQTVFNASRSHIGSAVNSIVERLRGANLAGIVLLSDGLDQSGEELTPQARAVPVFVPEIEDPDKVRRNETGQDTWIADVSYPKMTVVNWKVNVDVLVRRRGTDKASVPVHFSQGDRRIRSSAVQFEPGETYKQVTFEVEPNEVGGIIYRVQVEPEGDADPANNTREFLIEVTDPKNRVLYLEGTPRWEFKFLKRALLSEKNYQLSAFVQSGDGHFISFSEESAATRSENPTISMEELAKYRVLVLGDLPAASFKEEESRAIRDFVDKGGGLLLVGAGKAYGEGGWQSLPYLQELLPANSEPGARMNEGRFSVDLTPSGRAHPAVQALRDNEGMPPVLSYWGPVKTGEFSSVLLAGLDGSPVVVTRRYGQGRVAMLLSDSLWRWQMGSSSTSGSEKNLYNRFITQLVYWLAPSEKEVEKGSILQVVTARNQVETRDRVAIGAVLEGAAMESGSLTCTVATPDGKRQSLPMVPAVLADDVGLSRKVNGFKCVFTPAIPGRYEVAVSSADGTQQAKAVLLAADQQRERTGEPANRAYLQKLADQSGGKLLPWEKRYALLKDVPYGARTVQTVEEYPIWNRYWWLLVLITLFSVEWWWRRRLDLV